MRRLKKEHYDGLLAYARHLPQQKLEELAQQTEREGLEYIVIPRPAASFGSYTHWPQAMGERIVSLPADAFEEVGQ